MLIAHIRWRDALAVEGDHLPPTAALAELEEVGFLLAESEDAVLIGMEAEGPTPGRWRLNVPKAMILHMKVVEVERAFNRKARTVIG